MTRWMFWLPGVALASGSVGHPVTTAIAGGQGLSVSYAELPVTSLAVSRCDDTLETVSVDAVLDLVAGDPLTLPNGELCSLKINLGGRLNAAGSGDDGGTFSLSLAVGAITIDLDPPLEVVGGQSDALGVRVAIRHWITASSLGLSSGQHTHIGPQHAAHDGLRDAVRWDSALIR